MAIEVVEFASDCRLVDVASLLADCLKSEQVFTISCSEHIGRVKNATRAQLTVDVPYMNSTVLA